MKSKRLAALGLIAVLSLGLLTTCSGDSDDTSGVPAGSMPPVTKSGAPAIDSPANWTSVADLEGTKVAVQEGITGSGVASATPDAEVSAFKAVTQRGTELISDCADCVIVDTHPAQSLIDANPGKLMTLDSPAFEETETYAIATQKNDTGAALAEEFNTAVATPQENGAFDALVGKYIPKDEDAQLPELKTVENPKGALVMGINCEFEPFKYLDKNGGPTGLDVGLTQYLCVEMGYTLTIENMGFDALILALQSDRIDFIAAGLTRDEEWEKNANFTDGYYEAIQFTMVAKPVV